MRSIFVFACLALAIGGAVARYAEKDRPAKAGKPQPQATAMAASPVPPATLSRSVSLQSKGRHFQADARVNGQPIDFIVDTGASLIALRQSDAARAGIRVSPSDFTLRTQTANGVGRAARVQINRIDINGISLRDVDAMVMPDQALGVNLLGMSFLSRVKFAYDRGRMVIEQ